MVNLTSLNVAFSQRGALKLLSGADANDASFKAGQFVRAPTLGDDTTKWLPPFAAGTIDGLFKITGNPAEHVKKFVLENIHDPLHVGKSDTGFTVIFEHIGKVRPGKESGHEHFGFKDGISQPYCLFADDTQQNRTPLPGQRVVNPGVLVLGQTGDNVTRPAWAKNGSFLVYRHLQQLVPEFNKFLKDVVLSSIIIPPQPGTTDSGDIQKRVDFLGARLVGRWKSGTPVVLTPVTGGKIPVDDPTIGADPQRNDVFDYGPQGQSPREQLLCPYAGHTRKSGPRTDLPPAADEAHAILRSGIPFGGEVTPEEKLANKTLVERGLAFISYQSALSSGFEFIQQNWVNNTNFPPNTREAPGFDIIIGQNVNLGQPRTISGYDTDDLTKVLSVPNQFVVSQGGEYFIQPSITALKQFSTATA
jgi:Dyp-type peroxidase family